jgi:hypothetical protein
LLTNERARILTGFSRFRSDDAARSSGRQEERTVGRMSGSGIMSTQATWYARMAFTAVAGVVSVAGLQSGRAQQLVTLQKTRAAVAGVGGVAVEAINDVILIRDRIVALEGETNSLLVLSTDGRLLSRKSNTGADAAMLGYPIQMAPVGDHELVVLDAQKPRLARFALQNDSLQLLSVLRLSSLTGVTGACALGGQTFVLGRTTPPEKSKLLHAINPADATVRYSFGDGFGEAKDEFAPIFYGAGKLLCLSREQRLVIASENYPEVRAYDAQGTLLWSRSLPGFRPVTYQQVKRGSFRYNMPEDGLWDATVSVFQPADGLIAVQVGRRKGSVAGTKFTTIQTLLLSARDGSIVHVQRDVPFVKSAGAGRLFSVDDIGTLWFVSHRVEDR